MVTPLPWHLAAFLGESQGVIVRGISGSLFFGTRVEEIAWETRHADFRVSQLRLQFDEPWRILSTRKLRLSDVTAQAFSVTLKPAPSFVHRAPVDQRWLGVAALLNMEIQRLEVLEAHAGRAGSPLEPLGRINGQDLKLSRLLLESPGLQLTGLKLDLKTGPLQANHQGIQLIEGAQGTLRPSLKQLRKAVNFKLALQWLDSEYQVDVESSAPQMKFHWDPRMAFVEVKDFTPSEWLETPLPMRSLTLAAHAESPGQLLKTQGGAQFRFFLGGAEFNSVFEGDPTSHGLPKSVSNFQGVQYTLRLAPLARMLHGTTGELRSSAHAEVSDMLAAMFFRTQYVRVDPEGRRWIDLQAPLFSGKSLKPESTSPALDRLLAGEPVLAPERQLEVLKTLTPAQMNRLQQMREATHEKSRGQPPKRLPNR